MAAVSKPIDSASGAAKFDSSDLVVAFADGGYEQGPRANAVPEPLSLALMLLGLIAYWSRRPSTR